MGLNWDSHPVDIVEKLLTCESFAWKHSPAEEMRIFYERASFLSFQREHAQRPHASPIYLLVIVQKLMFKSVECDWLMNVRGTGYPFDKINDYKRIKQNNDNKWLFSITH